MEDISIQRPDDDIRPPQEPASPEPKQAEGGVWGLDIRQTLAENSIKDVLSTPRGGRPATRTMGQNVAGEFARIQRADYQQLLRDNNNRLNDLLQRFGVPYEEINFEGKIEAIARCLSRLSWYENQDLPRPPAPIIQTRPDPIVRPAKTCKVCGIVLNSAGYCWKCKGNDWTALAEMGNRDSGVTKVLDKWKKKMRKSK